MLEVVAALMERDGRFLACRRAPEKARGGRWEFPGGKVEPGETRGQALARELCEELGVQAEVGGEAAQVVHAYEDVTVRLTLLRVTLSGEPKRLEHADMRFMTMEEARREAFCPADRRLLRQLAGETVDHAAKARDLFAGGYNCAQAVVGAFADELGMTQHQAVRLASSFGGGMGGMRETCGAVTGMLMVAGLLFGYDSPKDDAGKKAHYAHVRALAEDFRAQHGTLVCRELLAALPGKLAQDPLPRTPEYYKVRPCIRFVETAAGILEQEMKAE